MRKDHLAETLALERIDTDLFRSVFVQVEDYSLYGGLVMGQALAAAGATVPTERVPHSLHGYFLRPGAADLPTVFRVERDRDGRTISSRRVSAVQQGRVIFTVAASFGDDVGDTVDQHVQAPDISAPEDLPVHPMRRYPTVEVRAETPVPSGLPHRFWVRATQPMPPDDLLQASALAYISDLSTGVRISPGLVPMASVDHALWIHHVPRADTWLLVDLVAQVRAGRRGLYTGSIFTADGRLAATLAQEMVVRRVEDASGTGPGFNRGSASRTP